MKNSVFLDLDETILDFGRAEAIAIRRTLEALDIEPTAERVARYSAVNLAHWKRLERGEITREQVLYGRFAVFFAQLGLERDVDAAKALYENFLSQGHYFIPGAPALLETLYGRYDLYLASNGTAAVQAGRLKSAGIEGYFQNIFISEKLGANKPSKAFFDACFAAIPAFDPSRAVIVGDSLSSDILGGINAGIRTVWFNPKDKPPDPAIPADYVIRALDELPGLLEDIFSLQKMN